MSGLSAFSFQVGSSGRSQCSIKSDMKFLGDLEKAPRIDQYPQNLGFLKRPDGQYVLPLCLCNAHHATVHNRERLLRKWEPLILNRTDPSLIDPVSLGSSENQSHAVAFFDIVADGAFQSFTIHRTSHSHSLPRIHLFHLEYLQSLKQAQST